MIENNAVHENSPFITGSPTIARRIHRSADWNKVLNVPKRIRTRLARWRFLDPPFKALIRQFPVTKKHSGTQLSSLLSLLSVPSFVSVDMKVHSSNAHTKGATPRFLSLNSYIGTNSCASIS